MGRGRPAVSTIWSEVVSSLSCLFNVSFSFWPNDDDINGDGQYAQELTGQFFCLAPSTLRDFGLKRTFKTSQEKGHLVY